MRLKVVEDEVAFRVVGYGAITVDGIIPAFESRKVEVYAIYDRVCRIVAIWELQKLAELEKGHRGERVDDQRDGLRLLFGTRMVLLGVMSAPPLQDVGLRCRFRGVPGSTNLEVSKNKAACREMKQTRYM